MDRTTKILLAAIAIGLWANAGVSALRPATAQGFSPFTDRLLQEILNSVDGIYRGTCNNKIICG
jgi:hypothetical protein